MGYEICWESEGGVTRRFFGYVTSNDLVNVILDTEVDIRFYGLQYIISDFLGIGGFCANPNDLQYISAMYSAGLLSNNPSIKLAVVFRAPEVGDLANQSMKSLRNVYPGKVFDTLASAKAWLGIHVEQEDSPLSPAELSAGTNFDRASLRNIVRLATGDRR